MSTQPPERAASAITPAGEWPGPDWADSQEVWPGNAEWPAQDPWGPQDRYGPHEGWPPAHQPTAQDYPTGAQPTVSAGQDYPTGAQPTVSAGQDYPTGAYPAVSAGQDYPSGVHPTVPTAQDYPTGAQPTVPPHPADVPWPDSQWPAGDWTRQPPGSWPEPGQAGPVVPPGYGDEPVLPWPAPAEGWGMGDSWADSGNPPGSSAAPGPAVPAQASREYAEPAPVPPAHAAADGDQRWAMAAYLSVPFFSFLVPLALLFISRRSPRLRAHAAQAVNAALTVLLYDVSAAILAGVLSLDSPTVAVSVVGSLVAALWVACLGYLVRAAGSAWRLSPSGRGSPCPPAGGRAG